jgi:hypothetical protein
MLATLQVDAKTLEIHRTLDKHLVNMVFSQVTKACD